ncbi:MAG: formyl-CoA transferase [Hyphomicrobium sp. SCN 65-11]|nr:MAG: formyl-CoA transferase [Hyphomicrobium sp. SCN 65-11]
MPFEPASDVLSQYTVLDLTRVRSGPTCVRQLADWGANVIKIEDPESDKIGLGGARSGSDFQNLHRNKRSMTLNLKTKEGIAIFMALAKKADVIVENYRPDVKRRLGIDYDAISKINPRIVYASISGFGQDGPLANRPGFDQIAQGMGGLMSITGEPGKGPMRVGIPIADLTAGIFCSQGILLALMERERSGKGQWVQTSLLQAQVFMLDFQASRWLMDKEIPPQAGNDHPTSIPTGVFKTSDGYINIAVAGQKMWEKFKSLFNDPAFDSPDYAEAKGRSKNRKALNALIESHTSKKTAAEWIAIFNEAGAPAGEINDIKQVFDLEQVRHLGLAQPMNSQERGATEVVGQPILMSRSKASVRRPPPTLGQHTGEILADIGYGPEDVKKLAKDGVI